MEVKELIKKIKNGEVKPGLYAAENDEKENVVLVCLKDKYIITYTMQKNDWIRINEYDSEGKMIGETYDK